MKKRLRCAVCDEVLRNPFGWERCRCGAVFCPTCYYDRLKEKKVGSITFKICPVCGDYIIPQKYDQRKVIPNKKR